MKLFILLLISLFSLSVSAQEAKMGDLQNSEKNKQLVRRIYEDCINKGDTELLSEIISDEYVGLRGKKGPSGFASTVVELRRGFPDIRFTLEDLIAEEDRVVVRWKWTGTHNGEFAGFQPSRNQVINNGIVIYRIKDGKVVEAWLQTDRLGVLQQIGAVSKEIGRPQPDVKQ